MFRVDRVGAALALGLLLLLSSCGPELSVTLDVEDLGVETLRDEVSPSVVFRNEGGRTIYLPTGWIEYGRNVELVMYRRSQGYPLWYSRHEGPYSVDAELEEITRETVDGTASTWKRQVDPAVSEEGARSGGGGDPELIELDPGETYRYSMRDVEAAAVMEADPEDPQIGIWNMRVFFNGFYPEEELERLSPYVRRRVWRGVSGAIRSNPVTIVVAERSDPGAAAP